MAFIERNRLYIEPKQLLEVVATIAAFLVPALSAVADGRSFVAAWRPGGPWA